LSKVINQLIELQQRLFLTDQDSVGILKELDLMPSDQNEKSSKRKLAEDIDEDDEEIYSDTDEEMRANEQKESHAAKMYKKFKFKRVEPEDFEDYLAKVHERYKKYR
jgi:hypothetical protein